MYGHAMQCVWSELEAVTPGRGATVSKVILLSRQIQNSTRLCQSQYAVVVLYLIQRMVDMERHRLKVHLEGRAVQNLAALLQAPQVAVLRAAGRLAQALVGRLQPAHLL